MSCIQIEYYVIEIVPLLNLLLKWTWLKIKNHSKAGLIGTTLKLRLGKKVVNINLFSVNICVRLAFSFQNTVSRPNRKRESWCFISGAALESHALKTLTGKLICHSTQLI